MLTEKECKRAYKTVKDVFYVTFCPDEAEKENIQCPSFDDFVKFKLKDENIPEERFIPKPGESYWFVNDARLLCSGVHYLNSGKGTSALVRNLAFETYEEAQDYADFLKIKDTYTHRFNKDFDNYCLCYKNGEFNVRLVNDKKREAIDANYFRSAEDVVDFIKQVGLERIEKYMFNEWSAQNEKE